MSLDQFVGPGLSITARGERPERGLVGLLTEAIGADAAAEESDSELSRYSVRILPRRPWGCGEYPGHRVDFHTICHCLIIV